MPTLLLRLVGPMQSWGTTSRFDQRDTGKEPSKSGVIGLLAAAMGIDREYWTELEPLTRLKMGVRHDRSGVLKYDYQTAGCADSDTVIRANGTSSDDGIVSQRHYLADAAFLVAFEGEDRELLKKAHDKLKNPMWPLALGRKSYLPAEPVWIKDGLQDTPLLDTLKAYPWLGNLRRWEEEPPEQLLVSLDSEDGSGVLKMDQPLSSFAERRFGGRFVRSEWIPFPLEVADVPE
ncbi:MAG: type I-E CRISPR-associated protein Cas5/CasD [Pedobacter sp.]